MGAIVGTMFRPLFLFAVLCLGGAAHAQTPEGLARGEYLFRAGGCLSCHTDEKNKGAELAGGRAFATPFGTFYSPNITADRATGIGTWTDAQFDRALRHGVRPDGAYYFPVFPYPSYAKMRPDDAKAIKDYLMSRPAVARANKPHDVSFPFSWRFLQIGWRMLYFRAGEWQPEAGKSAEINRGGYLVEALTHCGECHTPRNRLGALDRAMHLAGTRNGPDGDVVPNITPDKDSGIGNWSRDEIANLLETAETPAFSTVGKSMREAIDHGLKYLTDADRQAIGAYLLDQKPIANRVRPVVP